MLLGFIKGLQVTNNSSAQHKQPQEGNIRKQAVAFSMEWMMMVECFACSTALVAITTDPADGINVSHATATKGRR